MSTVKTVKYQVGTDGTSTNNFTIYQPDPPDGTMRVGKGNAGAATDVAKVDSNGFKFTSSIQIGTDATSSNNFTIYQPSTPDGTLRIGVGNADNPTEVAKFNSSGMTPKVALYYLSSNQTVNHGVFTTLAIDTVAFENLNGAFNTSTYTFTAPYAGKYKVTAQAYKMNTNSSYRAILSITKNGSQLARGYQSLPNGTEWFGIVNTSTILDVALNDTLDVRIYVLDSASASAEIFSGIGDTFLTIEYLGDF